MSRGWMNRNSALAILSLWCAVFLLAAPEGASAEKPAGKRQKVIDFEDEVVEGLNRRPLDSLSQISERDRKRRKPHLYRKRAGFRTETAESMRTLNLTPNLGQ